MRWLFLLLLLTNGFYYMWHQTTRVPHQAEPAAPEAGVAPLVLLSESSPNPPPASEPQPAAVETDMAATVPPLPEWCWELGPLTEEQPATALAKALQEGGYATEVSARQLPAAPDYWVYIGPFPTQSEGLAVVRELKQRKVDSYLVVSGELANSVSLGLFSEKARAERLRRQRSALGHEVKIHTRERTQPGFVVVATGAAQIAVFDADLAAALRAAKIAQIQKNSCN